MEKYRTVCMVRFELCFKICVRDKQPNNKRGKSIDRHFVEKQTRTAGRRVAVGSPRSFVTPHVSR